MAATATATPTADTGAAPEPEGSTPSGTASPGSSAIRYAYMFEKDKSPTKQFDALLRAIAIHIILKIGDKTDTHLTPTKLAAYYKVVGGDYDSIFIDCDHQALSLAWQKIGCQHTLQPTANSYAPPSIPALTLRGFSRWTSIEVLLGPDEHVPFVQYAVRNWNLRHPETGEPFPKDLPSEVFPAITDIDVDRWHKNCGNQLKIEAEASEKEQTRGSHKFAHTEHRGGGRGSSKASGPGRARFAEPEYTGVPFSYVHAHSTKHARFPGDRTGTHSTDRLRRESPPDDRERRRSWSDYPSPPPTEQAHYSYPPKAEALPKRPGQPRRHSHPRRYSQSSDDSEDGQDVPPPKAKRRSHGNSPPPPPSIRRTAPPPAPVPPPASSRAHRSELRPEDRRRQEIPSPRTGSLREKLTEKIGSILPNGIAPERPRYDSRNNSYNLNSVRPRRSRDFQSSRLNRSHSDIDSEHTSDLDSTDDEARRRRRVRDERERDREQRYRDRGRPNRESERDVEDDRDSGGRRDRPHWRRPEVQRRTSSHADIDRQRDMPQWDPRDWERWRRDKRRPAGDERSPSPGGRRYGGVDGGGYDRERV